jgi:hypothetical protein
LQIVPYPDSTHITIQLFSVNNKIHKAAVRGAFNSFIMVNSTLICKVGGDAAILIGYLIGEEAYLEGEKKLDSQGYFFCKVQKIEDKFNYSKDTQSSIIKKLVGAGLIEVHNKQIEGSESISKVRHFKLNHTAIFNMVNEIEAVDEVEDNLPEDLSNLRKVLAAFAKEHGAAFFTTEADEQVLKIARFSGISGSPEGAVVLTTILKDRHKRLKGKRVSCKYLLTAMVDFPSIENAAENKVVTKQTLLVA